MNALLLIAIILGVALQNVTKKIYNKISPAPGAYLFSTVSALAAVIFFAATSSELTFSAKVIPYSIAFAAAYTTALVGSVVAISSGPLSITSLITSFSLILPTLYGLIFLRDPISTFFYPAFALLILSLFLINKNKESVKIQVKWIVSVSFAFLGNGFCTIFQKMQQSRFQGEFKNEFMIIALIITAIFTCVMMLYKERHDLKKQPISAYPLGLLCGIFNGAVNLFVMILSGRMAISLMFPLISAGGIVAAYLIATVFYKEKLSRLQQLGVLFIRCQTMRSAENGWLQPSLLSCQLRRARTGTREALSSGLSM